jgi:hypothetical protein
MADFFLNDNKYGSLSQQDLKIFLDECDSKGLDYIRIDDISWQLLPPLLNVTLLIKLLAKDRSLYSFASDLKNRLYRQGANVIIDQKPEMRPELSDVLDFQIFLALSQTAQDPDPQVHLYYSLKAKEKSLAILGGLMKDFESTPKTSYKLVSYFGHLTSLKYQKMLNSPVPSIIIEFCNPEFLNNSQNNISEHLADNILCLYGSKTSPKKLKMLQECWDTATKSSLNNESTEQTAKYTVSSKPNKLANSITQTSPKQRTLLQSALSRKGAKKLGQGKADIFHPPPDSKVHYFIHPNEAPLPIFSPTFLNSNNMEGRVIIKSTFRKPVPNSSASVRKSSEAKVPLPTSFLQSLKQLEQLIDN